jgi:IPT/TIG domain
VITSSSLSSPQGADFDLAGDLWVGSAGSNTVSEFTPGQLGASGSPQAASTVSSAAISDPTGIVVAQAPVVTSLTEKQTGAGTEVAITGRGFYPGAIVHFGSTPAASVTYLSPFELKALAPSGSGQVDVTVSTGEGTSANSPGDVYAFGGVVDEIPRSPSIPPAICGWRTRRAASPSSPPTSCKPAARPRSRAIAASSSGWHGHPGLVRNRPAYVLANVTRAPSSLLGALVLDVAVCGLRRVSVLSRFGPERAVVL